MYAHAKTRRLQIVPLAIHEYTYNHNLWLLDAKRCWWPAVGFQPRVTLSQLPEHFKLSKGWDGWSKSSSRTVRFPPIAASCPPGPPTRMSETLARPASGTTRFDRTFVSVTTAPSSGSHASCCIVSSALPSNCRCGSHLQHKV